MKLTSVEVNLLEKLFIERLLHNWDVCDSTLERIVYEKVADECTTLKHLAVKLSITYPVSIANRF